MEARIGWFSKQSLQLPKLFCLKNYAFSQLSLGICLYLNEKLHMYYGIVFKMQIIHGIGHF